MEIGFSEIWNVVVGVFAVAGWFNAWQWKKHAKRAELYNQRYQIYSAFRKLLSLATAYGALKQSEIDEFMESTDQAQFLLGPEFERFRNKLFENAVELNILNKKVEQVGNGLSTSEHYVIEQRQAIFDWISSVSDGLKDRFGSALDLSS